MCQVKDNIWDANLAELGSLSSFIPGVKCLLCMTDIFTKYAWVKSLKDKKAKTVFQGFTEIINKSKYKPNKSWIHQGREFYNNFIQK